MHSRVAGMNSELMLLQAKDLPRAELIPILQLLLSPATPAMEGHCKQHHHWLCKLAVTAVESAESACLAHITTAGETSSDDALQEKVVKAAYAAAAVDHMTAQVHSPYQILTLGVVFGAPLWYHHWFCCGWCCLMFWLVLLCLVLSLMLLILAYILLCLELKLPRFRLDITVTSRGQDPRLCFLTNADSYAHEDSDVQ